MKRSRFSEEQIAYAFRPNDPPLGNTELADELGIAHRDAGVHGADVAERLNFQQPRPASLPS
ncbi:hypothetical protein SRS16P3_00362 (plasmid) [Variovorax sp. SRS16]|nr:hypothetical protein SRS16P3_00362 [Variovorax sp. SRS16]